MYQYYEKKTLIYTVVQKKKSKDNKTNTVDTVAQWVKLLPGTLASSINLSVSNTKYSVFDLFSC